MERLFTALNKDKADQISAEHLHEEEILQAPQMLQLTASQTLKSAQAHCKSHILGSPVLNSAFWMAVDGPKSLPDAL